MRVQKVITWRMESRRLDEQLLVLAEMKEERLIWLLGMRMVKYDKVEPMDWFYEEMWEHEYLGKLMEKLELGFYDAIVVGSDEEMSDATE